MGVDLRQVVAGVVTLTMFLMLANMIKRDHFDSLREKLQGGTEDANFESAKFDGTHIRKSIGLWKKDVDGLKPCWIKPSVDDVEQTEGFVTFALTNGPEYHISQIADAVIVARNLGATLDIPDIRGSQPGDKKLALNFPLKNLKD